MQTNFRDTNKLHFIAMAEGFALLSFSPRDDGSEGELINLQGFTSDIRKATPIASKQKAFGIAKFLASSKQSRRSYYCIMEATNETL